MILGQGTAQTDDAIIQEYFQFLDENGGYLRPVILKRLKKAPFLIQQRLGKSLGQWRESDLLRLYADQDAHRRYICCAFLAFLFMRGYLHGSLRLLVEFPGHFCRTHKQALQPYRQKLETAREALGYRSDTTGAELNLLAAMLVVRQKTLETLTRADFEAFRDQYQAWYRHTAQRKEGRPNSRLSRLENYLRYWDIIDPAPVTYRHEERLARLAPTPIRSAVLFYLDWCTVRDAPGTIVSRRQALLDFFLWLQESYPHSQRLDNVTRPVALAYAKHLHALREQGQRSLSYCNDLYRFMRLFYEFVIQEQLETSPDRNPFGLKDIATEPSRVRRYLTDEAVRKVLTYCQQDASLKERTVVTILLHTGIRAAELAALKVTDIVEIHGKWKLHIHEGKGLKDRLIPLTPQCLTILRTWQAEGWEQLNDYLFTRYSRPWRNHNVASLIHTMGKKLDLPLSPHRFRHTFAVALLNYGMRETALQKIMGHTTLNMTLEYARILDQTVEHAFTAAVEQMQDGPLSWVPNLLAPEDYPIFAEADAVSWIRLPLGYCRRNPKLHCESDVKCMLCDRFVASPEDLPKLKAMHERFQSLGLQIKAEVVAAQIHRLESQAPPGFIPLNQIEMPPVTRSSPTFQSLPQAGRCNGTLWDFS